MNTVDLLLRDVTFAFFFVRLWTSFEATAFVLDSWIILSLNERKQKKSCISCSSSAAMSDPIYLSSWSSPVPSPLGLHVQVVMLLTFVNEQGPVTWPLPPLAGPPPSPSLPPTTILNPPSPPHQQALKHSLCVCVFEGFETTLCVQCLCLSYVKISHACARLWPVCTVGDIVWSKLLSLLDAGRENKATKDWEEWKTHGKCKALSFLLNKITKFSKKIQMWWLWNITSVLKYRLFGFFSTQSSCAKIFLGGLLCADRSA